MKASHFRICRFRSIQDTGWIPFSPDSITALVGQNESGKSSVLDGLYLLSSTPVVDADDFRLDEAPPEACLRLALDESDLEAIEAKFDPLVFGAIEKTLRSQGMELEVHAVADGETTEFSLGDEFRTAAALNIELTAEVSEHSENEEPLNPAALLARLTDVVWGLIPEFVLFRDDRCQLPNRIDIPGGELPNTVGRAGAENFLKAAGIDIEVLLTLGERERSTTLARACAKLNDKLKQFWTQVLGVSQRVRIECAVSHYDASEAGKAGQPYLVFWVCDASDKQCPSQRSKGTRWFISFFLQLLAAEKSEHSLIYLLDEPGAYLHATGQEDVVRLIEHLAGYTGVVYTTHSPYLLDQKKLHRVIAIERAGDDAASHTILRRGLELAAASTITMAPILTLMGVDLSHQQVIKRNNNVVLEEPSAYYYLEAMRCLLKIEGEIHFVAASGVDNVKLISDLFVAWGIEHAILVDDDPHGKKVRREIKAKWLLSDEEANRRLQAIEGCDGVEDLFEEVEFRKVVAPGLAIKPGKNSEAMKRSGASKPMAAVNFYLRCRSGEVALDALGDGTLVRFRSIFDRLFRGFESTDC